MARTLITGGYHAAVELRHLRYFVAVASELNYTRAANRLRIAQPALSKQIQQLELEIGVQLLERDRRHVRLTEAGRSFMAEAQAILERSEAAIQRARSAQEESRGTLTLGYVWGLFHSIVPPMLATFRGAHPLASVHLLDVAASRQARLVTEGKLDAGFIGFAEEADAPGLTRQRIGFCKFEAVLPVQHRLAKRARVRLQDLANEIFIAVSDESYPGAAKIMTEACRKSGFQPRILQAAERGFTIPSLVAAHCGVALLPATLRDLPHQGVVFRPLMDAPCGDLFLVWNRKRCSSLLTKFLSALQ